MNIKHLEKQDISIITQAFSKLGWNKPTPLYEQYLQEQEEEKRCVWVAWKGNNFLGYVTLLWQSRYESFIKQHIPEVVDLNVLPAFRNQGIGSQLLELAEQKALERGKLIGLGVGLYKDYGAAQKLYIKRGYIPDGRGITYNNLLIQYGGQVQLDDELVLWLIKAL